MIGSAEDVVEEHASVQQVKLAHQQPILGTLDECFRLYTQEEQVYLSYSTLNHCFSLDENLFIEKLCGTLFHISWLVMMPGTVPIAKGDNKEL